MHKSLAFFGAAARRTRGRDLENKTALPDLIFIMVFGKRRKISSVCLFSQCWKTFRLTGVCLHLNPDGWYDFQIRLGKSTPIPYSWEGKHGTFKFSLIPLFSLASVQEKAAHLQFMLCPTGKEGTQGLRWIFYQPCASFFPALLDLDIPEGGAIGLNLNFTSLDFFLPMCDDIHNPTFSFIP